MLFAKYTRQHEELRAQERERGMMVKYAFYDSEFGYLKFGYTDTAITYLKRAEGIDDINAHSGISDLAFSQIREYLDGKRKCFDFPCELRGTEFYRKTWQALCGIPYGETRTYKEIAVAVGNPKAARAVGMANHNNPIWIAIPCHRVVSAGGGLAGYAGGLAMKEALLTLERTQTENLQA